MCNVGWDTRLLVPSARTANVRLSETVSRRLLVTTASAVLLESAARRSEVRENN